MLLSFDFGYVQSGCWGSFRYLLQQEGFTTCMLTLVCCSMFNWRVFAIQFFLYWQCCGEVCCTALVRTIFCISCKFGSPGSTWYDFEFLFHHTKCTNHNRYDSCFEVPHPFCLNLKVFVLGKLIKFFDRNVSICGNCYINKGHILFLWSLMTMSVRFDYYYYNYYYYCCCCCYFRYYCCYYLQC